MLNPPLQMMLVALAARTIEKRHQHSAEYWHKTGKPMPPDRSPRPVLDQRREGLEREQRAPPHKCLDS
jgi:hypothetical protein